MRIRFKVVVALMDKTTYPLTEPELWRYLHVSPNGEFQFNGELFQNEKKVSAEGFNLTWYHPTEQDKYWTVEKVIEVMNERMEKYASQQRGECLGN